MTDDEFKRLLYKKLEEDKKNEGILTNRLYNQTQKLPKENTIKKYKPKPN